MEPGRADCICKPGRADISREIKADRSTAGEMPTAPSPSLRPGSHAAGRRRRKKNAFFLRPGFCQREGDAQGCLVLPARLQLAPTGREVAGCIPRGEESEWSRDRHLHPGGDGARLVGNGTRPHHLPLGTWQQTLVAIASNLYIVKIKSLWKVNRSEGMAAPLSLPTLTVSPHCRPPPAAGDRNVRKTGTHMTCDSSPGSESKINTCSKGQVGKLFSNDGSGGPWASPEALR